MASAELKPSAGLLSEEIHRAPSPVGADGITAIACLRPGSRSAATRPARYAARSAGLYVGCA
jgi:hypothetical protein